MQIGEMFQKKIIKNLQRSEWIETVGLSPVRKERRSYNKTGVND